MPRWAVLACCSAVDRGSNSTPAAADVDDDDGGGDVDEDGE